MRKEEIKQTALCIFANNGYSGCTLQEIADIVGVNKATFFYYFKNKAALFLSILKDQIDNARNKIIEVIESSTDNKLSVILYSIAHNYVFELTQDQLLFNKNAMLMVLGNNNTDVAEPAREMIFAFINETLTLLKSLLTKKSNAPQEMQSVFISSYYFFIQSLMDRQILYNYFPCERYGESMRNLWNAFWNGNKAVVEN